MPEMFDPARRGRECLFASSSNVLQASLPHVCLLIAFYSLVGRQRLLGIAASLLGIYWYIAATFTYHICYKGTTALFCFAYLYAAIKLAEIAIVLVTRQETDYDYQNTNSKIPRTLFQKLMWAARVSVNLRCIGLKCGKNEKDMDRPKKSQILIPTFIRLGSLDLATTIVHHLALYNSHLAFIHRPFWQQASLTVLMGYCLFAVFTGTYGLAHFVGVFVLDMPQSQWPPMLIKPWAATSLRQFWSKEWHSVFRRIFTFFTDVLVKPISHALELKDEVQLSLNILVVFLLSALFHDWGIWLTLGKHSGPTLFFFAIQGPAVLLEEKLGLTRKPWLGWIWTYTFLIVTGGPFGMIGAIIDTDGPSNTFITDGFFKDGSLIARLINFCFGSTI